jgi:hypothetical protein
MGIERSLPFLLARLVESVECYIAKLDKGNYLVDVMSVLFRDIMHFYFQNPRLFGVPFWKKVQKYFANAPEGVTFEFVLDGRHSDQKATETRKRDALANASLGKVKSTIKNNKRKKKRRCGRKRSQKRWSNGTWKYLAKHTRKSFRITQEIRNELFKTGISLGLTVIQADGEADVFLATRPPLVNGARVINNVISTDTDLLFHQGTDKIFRPVFKGTRLYFSVYSKSDILESLFPSVSLNKRKNIPGLSGNQGSKKLKSTTPTSLSSTSSNTGASTSTPTFPPPPILMEELFFGFSRPGKFF